MPVAWAFAYRYRINPLLLGLSVLNGTNADGFSPGPVFALTFVTNLLLDLRVHQRDVRRAVAVSSPRVGP